MPTTKLVFTCGGTGGHIYPALALAQELAPISVVFLGSKDRIDGETVRRHGYPFYGIASSRARVLGVIMGVLSAFGHLWRIRPRIVVCTGGMITFPVALAAWILRIPIMVLEQNRIAGRTNRVLSFLAREVVTAFPDTIGLETALPLGNPVRKQFLRDRWVDEWRPVLAGQSMIILVFGGSQGAQAVNDTVQESYPLIADQGWFVIHILGDRAYKAAGYSGDVYPLKTDAGPFGIALPYAESMDILYRMASVVVCRAGATSIAELIEFQKPSVLIPYPFAKDDHQTANAEWMARSGRAIVVKETQLMPHMLNDSIQRAAGLRVPAVAGNPRERIAARVREYLR
jgi:UDP-N-acetylglucosamine--N-acetylmuramyl-(pentapeptide) pyrophosphoryl-undecaprenol N-acetylglucosamine transferase